MKEYLTEAIQKALALGAHDLHLKTAFSPMIRVANAIQRLDHPAIAPKEMEKLVYEILEEKHIGVFKARGQVDCSIEFPGMVRARANIFFQRNSLALSLRLVPPLPPPIEKLGFPQDIIDMMLKLNRGMMLITGATNSGKSTTAASLIDSLARAGGLHIVSIEDPIEYAFPPYPSSIISQRQVGEDCPNFQAGLTSSLRQDPDVLFIGELRDQETVETALKAAETGHLVIGTLHTATASQSILRLINIFPSHQRDNVRFMLSSCLKVVVSQVLLPNATRKGRALAYEVLPMLPSICNLIRQKKIHEISSILRVGRRSGCIPMSATIKDLVKAGTILPEDVPLDYRDEK